MYNPNKKEVFPGQMSYIRNIEGKNIFIGDIKSANDLNLIKRNNISTIISLLDKEDFKELQEFSDIKYNKFIIQDGEGNIIPICEKVKEIIDGESGNILVHCYVGKSRSASVVIFYLMDKNNIPYSDARKIVKNSRSIIDPVPHYKNQLLKYREERTK